MSSPWLFTSWRQPSHWEQPEQAMSSRWHLAFAPTFQGLSTPFPGLSQKLQHDPALWSWPSRCLQFVVHWEQPEQARSSRSHLAFAAGRHQGLSTPFPGLSQKLQHDPALGSWPSRCLQSEVPNWRWPSSAPSFTETVAADVVAVCTASAKMKRSMVMDESGPVAARGGTRCEVGIWARRKRIVRPNAQSSYLRLLQHRVAD